MTKNKTILIVDDIELNINTLINIFEDRYDILATADPLDVFELLETEKIDLILLDIVMPKMNGFEVCKKIKENHNTRDIPIIFITAQTDEDSIENAYSIGGVDYITKPFRSVEILSRVSTHISLNEKKQALEGMVDKKTKQLQELNQELEDTQREIIFTMGEISERRSKEVGYHVKRVALYSEILAKRYGLSPKDTALLKEASPMHDIGKVAIPDFVLNKPDILTPEEFEIMKTHTQLGYDMLKHSQRELLKVASVVAFEHHEKWDGSGYPRGLKGEEISIQGRITAIADVFDALSNERIYKKAWSKKEIIDYFAEQRGGHFEPKLVDIFFDNQDMFFDIRAKFHIKQKRC